MASESVAEQPGAPAEVTDESLFLTSSAASRRHLVYPAGFGQDAALTAHWAVIHSRVPRFATLKGEGSFDSDFLALPHSV